MKLIALDVGTKRIGVAKADSKVRIAIPFQAVEVNGEEFQKISCWRAPGTLIISFLVCLAVMKATRLNKAPMSASSQEN